MTSTTPYTKAYTENLVASLERTRAELKQLIGDLMDTPGLPPVYKSVEQMHRMVSSITDDLQS